MDHQLVHNIYMTHVSISDAKAQLTDLVRRAEAGEHVVLTRHGREVIRLAPVRTPNQKTRDERAAAIRAAQAMVGDLPADFDAARSQDFLYDEDGLPA
ncbi:type II toxin-antitoxin system Phd/YefM family antitoxin [Brevundimonas sp.]|uniref:type II toxin-antitoxin system Phd/YefM family antitoxin n=1 Tax=Brevundimonas sp. TaxID=1871086 RepID=UPI0035655425